MTTHRQLDRFLCAIIAAATLLAACSAPSAASDDAYIYEFVGSPQASVSIPHKPDGSAFVLMGGGEDVDEAFRWMIRKAGIRPGGGGRFVVLRATGTPAYNPYIYFSGPGGRTAAPVADGWVGGKALGLSSVETLIIPNRNAAENAFVNAVVAQADALFIAGGDQSNYIRYWKGTRLEDTLNALLASRVPIGGTSAGLAILGAFSFAAMHGTVNSTRALSNPFDDRVTIDPDPSTHGEAFLSARALADTITDSHFVRRDRMGRLIAFVSRLVAPDEGVGCQGGVLAPAQEEGRYPRGIGVSEQAALLVKGDPESTRFTARRIKNPWVDGDAPVYFVRPLEAPSLCRPGMPLTVSHVEVRRLADSTTVFDLTDWSGVERYLVDVQAGTLDESPY